MTYQRIDRAMVVTNLSADGEERLGKERIWADWVLATWGGRRRGTGRGVRVVHPLRLKRII